MRSQEAVVTNTLGLHARPVAKLVALANQFQCDIFLSFRSRRANAKSIVGAMILGAPKGAKVLVECSGPDEEEALARVTELIESGFGEK